MSPGASMPGASRWSWATTPSHPEGRILRRSYDPRRRLLTETNGAGETTTFAYDGNGNLTTRTLPLGGQWRFTYDSADRLTVVANPLNQATAFTYDRNDNLRTQTDAAASVVSFRYDALDRREAKIYPDGAEETVTYDPVGNLRTRGDPNGQQVTFTYDALNREVERAYSAPFHPVAEQLESITFNYDPNNNLTTATENYGATTRTTTRQYDPFDRLIAVVDGFGQQLRYQYDANGNRTALLAPDGAVTTYRFDALNRPNAVTLASGGTATYNWRRNSLLRQVTYPNGVTTIHNYDAANRLTDLTTTQPGGITASAFEYEYDLNGNRTVQREENGTLTAGALEETTYQYDGADRLLAITYPNRTTTYTLDAVGNRRTERTVDGLGTELANRTYTYNARHHLTSLLDTVDPTGSRSYVYDANGNQITKTQNGVTTDYLYDARNQLLEVQEDGLLQGTYSFDYQGLRVRKTGGGEILRYVYDDQSVLLQTDDFGNPIAKYDYGPDRLIALNHATQGRNFYHFDTLGSVANLTDSNGAVTARYQYDAWGVVTAETGTAFNPFGFTGQERDDATGLYYFKARFYDPELGRFLSEDPFEGVQDIPPSLHAYLYAFGNPTIYLDPTGQCVLGLPCPEAARQVIDYGTAYVDASLTTTMQVAEGVRSGVVSTVDLATLGTVSHTLNQTATFLVEDGTISERAAISGRAGLDARLDFLSVGFYSAEDRKEHAYQLVRQTFAVEQFESGTQRLVNGFFEGDAEEFIRGGAELLGASSQVVLVVAGAAEAGGLTRLRPKGPVAKIEGISQPRAGSAIPQPKRSVPPQQTIRDRVMENIRESADARATRGAAQTRNRVRANLAESANARAARNAAEIRNRARSNIAESRAARGDSRSGKGKQELPIFSVDGRMPEIAMNTKKALGSVDNIQLTRIKAKSSIRANRRAALRGQPAAGKGLSLDEFPFACTAQGGSGACVKSVPAREQSIQGGLLSQFFRRHNIGDGDDFVVVVIDEGG
jgi:RHS repeat-associated protein